LKRTGLLIAIVLTIALVALGSAAPVAVAASGAQQASRAAANGCPLYISCMDFVGVGCSCTGFVCNGKFICGTPVQVHPLP
jgi:hypothetical protein